MNILLTITTNKVKKASSTFVESITIFTKKYVYKFS